MTLQIGDLVKHKVDGYTAIVINVGTNNAAIKVKPLDYNSHHDWLWVLASVLEKVS